MAQRGLGLFVLLLSLGVAYFFFFSPGQPAARTPWVFQGADVAESATSMPAVPTVSSAAPLPDAPPLIDAPVPAPDVAYPVEFLLEDEAGVPVVGAQATLTILGDPERAAFHTSVPLLTPVGAPRKAVSDEDGALRFDAVPMDQRVIVRVPAGPGRAPLQVIRTFRTSSVAEGGGTLPLGPPGRSFELQVDGVASFPAGSSVWLRSGLWNRVWSDVPRNSRTYAAELLDDKGRAHIKSVPPVELSAEVFLPGVGAWRGIPIPSDATGVVRLSLADEAVGRLSGVVRDARGDPIPHAALSLGVEPFLTHLPARRRLLLTRADAKGRYDFPAVPSGRITSLEVRAEGYLAPRDMLQGVPLLLEETVEVDVLLIRAGAVTGRLVDEAGEPVAGARIRTSNDLYTLHGPRRSYTDAQGRYRVEGVGPGEVGLSARTSALKSGTARLRISAGGIARAPDLVLGAAPPGKISGFVEDQEGRPVAGVRIHLRVTHAAQGNVRGSGTISGFPTDSEGRFTLPGIQADVVKARVWGDKLGVSTNAVDIDVAEARAGTAFASLGLRSPGQIRGRVLDAAGKPLHGLRVSVVDTRLGAGTSANGRFRVYGVPVGPALVRVVGREGEALSDAVVVEVRRNEIAVVDLEARSVPHSLAVRGHLLDERGRPLPGVVVSAGRPDESDHSDSRDVAGRDGSFTIAVKQRGDYAIRSGDLLLHARLPAGSESVDVIFDPRNLRAVGVYVQGAGGHPVHSTHVEFPWPGRTRARIGESRGPGGYYRFLVPADAPDGLELIVGGEFVDGDGVKRRGTEQTFLAAPGGQEPTVTLQAVVTPDRARASALRGRVLDEDGVPVPGAYVMAVERRGRSTRSSSVWSDEQGSFSIEWRRAQKPRLHVDTPCGFTRPDWDPVIDPRDGPVEVRLRRLPPEECYRVQGQLLDVRGKPAARVPLIVAGRNLRDGVTTDERGRFSVDGLPRGRDYELRLNPRWEPPGGGDHVRGLRGSLATLRQDVADLTLTLAFPVYEPRELHAVEGTINDPKSPEGIGEPFSVSLEPEGDEQQGRRYGRFAFRSSRFTFEPVPAGRYTLRVSTQEFDSLYLSPEPLSIQVPCGPLVIELHRNHELHGTVKGEDVEDLWVIAFSQDGAWKGREIGASGAFALRLPTKGPFSLLVRRAGDDRHALVRDVRTDASPHDLVLERGLRIEGRIEEYEPEAESQVIAAHGEGIWADGLIEKDGRFVITGVPPGTYTVRYKCFGGSSHSAFQPAQAQAGDTGVVVKPQD